MAKREFEEVEMKSLEASSVVEESGLSGGFVFFKLSLVRGLEKVPRRLAV